MFQCVKKHNCVFDMCIFYFLKADTVQFIIIFFRREKLVYVLSNEVGPIVFNIFTKVSLNNIV